MKVNYRGHTISVEKDTSMMGEKMIYFWVVRDEDKYMIEDNMTYADAASVREMVSVLKERVDAEIVDWERTKSKRDRFLSSALERYNTAHSRELGIKGVFEYFRRNQKDKELLGLILKSLPLEDMTTEFIVTFGMASAAYLSRDQQRTEFCSRVLTHFEKKRMQKKQVLSIFQR